MQEATPHEQRLHLPPEARSLEKLVAREAEKLDGSPNAEFLSALVSAQDHNDDLHD
jgi:hypothetical protein